MPPELLHGKWVNPTLAIIGADHGEYSTTIHLWTDRLDARPKNKQRRTSLFVRTGVHATCSGIRAAVSRCESFFVGRDDKS